MTKRGTWYQRGLWKMWARYPRQMWRVRRRSRAIHAEFDASMEKVRAVMATPAEEIEALAEKILRREP